MESNYKTKKYFIKFSELGAYDSLEYWFDTQKEAEKKFKEFEKESDKQCGFFGFIAEIKICRRKEVFEE